MSSQILQPLLTIESGSDANITHLVTLKNNAGEKLVFIVETTTADYLEVQQKIDTLKKVFKLEEPGRDLHEFEVVECRLLGYKTEGSFENCRQFF